MPPVTKLEVKITAPALSLVGTQKADHNDGVKDRILALVVEKTGYQQDMLDLDLDLEADLGVDTVKQAEMFAAIREMYSIPRDENRKLRDYPTLAHVIQFVYDKRPDLANAAPVPPIGAATPTAKPDVKPALNFPACFSRAAMTGYIVNDPSRFFYGCLFRRRAKARNVCNYDPTGFKDSIVKPTPERRGGVPA